MKTCPRCRQYCADQKITCPKCGASLDASNDPVPSSQKAAYATRIADLCKTLEANPADDGIRRTLIEEYRAQGDWGSVAAHLQVLTEADPENLALKEDLFKAWKAAGRAGEAALTLKAMIHLQPGDLAKRERMYDLIAGIELDSMSEGQKNELARCWVECGDASCKRGEADEAVAFYLKAYQACVGIGAGERLADLYSGWATTHEKAKAYSQAIATLSAAVAYAPNDVSLQERLRKAQQGQFRNWLLWGIVGFTGVVIAFCFLLYLYQGGLDVHITSSDGSDQLTAKSQLIYDGWGTPQLLVNPFRFRWLKRGNIVWEIDGSQGMTPLLPGGNYFLTVEGLGYQRVKHQIRIGFGRETQVARATLIPVSSTLTSNSDSSGAIHAREWGNGSKPVILPYFSYRSTAWSEYGPGYTGSDQLHARNIWMRAKGYITYAASLPNLSGENVVVFTRLSSELTNTTSTDPQYSSDVTLLINGQIEGQRTVIPDDEIGHDYTWHIPIHHFHPGANEITLRVGDGTHNNGIVIYRPIELRIESRS